MSKINISKWNLNKSKKSSKKTVESLIQEQDNLGLWSGKYDSYPEDSKEGMTSVENEEYDDAEEGLFISDIEADAFSEEPGVTIVDDPFDDEMFEMDDPLEQGSAAISLDETDEDDFSRSLDDLEGPESDLDNRELQGLEGPFNFQGRELYYDPEEEGGQYYDRGTDMYLDNDEATRVVMGEEDEDVIDFSSLSLSEEDSAEDSEKEIPLHMITTIAYDFSPLWWGGQADRLYRIGSSGTMYPDDIDYVEMKIERAIEEDDFSDPSYTEMLAMAEDEIRNVKREFGSEMSESDELDIDINDQSSMGSFYTGEGEDDADQDLTGDGMMEMDFIDQDLTGDGMMEMDFIGQDNAVETSGSRTKSYAEGQMSEDDNKSIPEPFWSYGFPQIKLRDMAESLMQSMVPGGDKRHTLEIIDFMRRELDTLEKEINSKN